MFLRQPPKQDCKPSREVCGQVVLQRREQEAKRSENKTSKLSPSAEICFSLSFLLDALDVVFFIPGTCFPHPLQYAVAFDAAGLRVCPVPLYQLSATGLSELSGPAAWRVA